MSQLCIHASTRGTKELLNLWDINRSRSQREITGCKVPRPDLKTAATRWSVASNHYQALQLALFSYLCRPCHFSMFSCSAYFKPLNIFNDEAIPFIMFIYQLSECQTKCAKGARFTLAQIARSSLGNMLCCRLVASVCCVDLQVNGCTLKRTVNQWGLDQPFFFAGVCHPTFQKPTISRSLPALPKKRATSDISARDSDLPRMGRSWTKRIMGNLEWQAVDLTQGTVICSKSSGFYRGASFSSRCSRSGGSRSRDSNALARLANLKVSCQN